MFKFAIITILLLVDYTNSSFDMKLFYSDQELQLTLEPIDKKALVRLSLSESTISICCKPTRTIFQKIYYFLINPFFHTYDYSCKQPHSNIETQTFKIPIIGLLQLSYVPIESPDCSIGTLGLDKKSYFLSALPIQTSIFTIKLTHGKHNEKQGIITFDQSTKYLQNMQSSTTIQSKGQQLWQFEFKGVKFDEMGIDGSKFILQTNAKQLKIPSNIYQKIVQYFLISKKCSQFKSSIICPCQTGVPESYPSFQFQLSSTFNFSILPSEYMSAEGEVCELHLISSSNPYWQISLQFFNNIEFKFDTLNNQITLTRFQQQSSSNQVIKLPIQLILNCCVILILCVFVALVLVEILKRLSGLAEARNEQFREYMIRRQI